MSTSDRGGLSVWTVHLEKKKALMHRSCVEPRHLTLTVAATYLCNTESFRQAFIVTVHQETVDPDQPAYKTQYGPVVD